MHYETYSVLGRTREPLLGFILESLKRCGCKVLKAPPPDEAPFRIIFETPAGERHGILCYAFTATFTPTKNRPDDEHSFQIKYGSKVHGKLHEIAQDPTGLFTTLFLGINAEKGFFVGIDPVLNSPTRFFIRFEFKQKHVRCILRDRWHYWERPLRRPLSTGKIPSGFGDAHQVVIGGTAESFLKYVMFERWARGLDQGHRGLLAEKASASIASLEKAAQLLTADLDSATGARIGQRRDLADEFELSEQEILQIIANNRRLMMAVRGGIAEEHLRRQLSAIPGVTHCVRNDGEGAPDISLLFEGRGPLNIECKNVLRKRNAKGLARIDFMRTRASPADPCSRYYELDKFDVVAGCLHPVTMKWEFRYALPRSLDAHDRCKGRLSNKVFIDARWQRDARRILRAAARA